MIDLGFFGSTWGHFMFQKRAGFGSERAKIIGQKGMIEFS